MEVRSTLYVDDTLGATEHDAHVASLAVALVFLMDLSAAYDVNFASDGPHGSQRLERLGVVEVLALLIVVDLHAHQQVCVDDVLIEYLMPTIKQCHLRVLPLVYLDRSSHSRRYVFVTVELQFLLSL